MYLAQTAQPCDSISRFPDLSLQAHLLLHVVVWVGTFHIVGERGQPSSNAAQRTLSAGTLLHYSGALPAGVELLRVEQRTVARL